MDLEMVCQTIRFFGLNCFYIGCKCGSGIRLPYQMVSLAQTISRLAATVLYQFTSVHGARFGHTNRSQPDH